MLANDGIAIQPKIIDDKDPVQRKKLYSNEAVTTLKNILENEIFLDSHL